MHENSHHSRQEIIKMLKHLGLITLQKKIYEKLLARSFTVSLQSSLCKKKISNDWNYAILFHNNRSKVVGYMKMCGLLSLTICIHLSPAPSSASWVQLSDARNWMDHFAFNRTPRKHYSCPTTISSSLITLNSS